MNSDIFQLVYIAFTTEQFDLDKDIVKILQKASDYNSTVGITGLLLFKGGVFLQLLEGNKVEVDKLYAKILSDPRQKDAKTLLTKTAQKRICPEWTMNYRMIEELDLQVVNAVLEWNQLQSKAERGDPIDNAYVLSLLNKLKKIIENG